MSVGAPRLGESESDLASGEAVSGAGEDRFAEDEEPEGVAVGSTERGRGSGVEGTVGDGAP